MFLTPLLCFGNNNISLWARVVLWFVVFLEAVMFEMNLKMKLYEYKFQRMIVVCMRLSFDIIGVCVF
jgi:hypothetical protein